MNYILKYYYDHDEVSFEDMPRLQEKQIDNFNQINKTNYLCIKTKILDYIYQNNYLKIKEKIEVRNILFNKYKMYKNYSINYIRDLRLYDRLV
jgi:hypothetical protein